VYPRGVRRAYADGELSPNAGALLRALRWYDNDYGEPAAGRISEIAIKDLARFAKLSVEQATEAAGEIVASGRPGITLDGDNVVMRD
jgi:hypothetical protein